MCNIIAAAWQRCARARVCVRVEGNFSEIRSSLCVGARASARNLVKVARSWRTQTPATRQAQPVSGWRAVNKTMLRCGTWKKRQEIGAHFPGFLYACRGQAERSGGGYRGNNEAKQRGSNLLYARTHPQALCFFSTCVYNKICRKHTHPAPRNTCATTLKAF